MSEGELIDVVNERAAYDDSFRGRLEQAVATKNNDLLRTLIDGIAQQLHERVGCSVVDQVASWFIG